MSDLVDDAARGWPVRPAAIYAGGDGAPLVYWDMADDGHVFLRLHSDMRLRNAPDPTPVRRSS